MLTRRRTGAGVEVLLATARDLHGRLEDQSLVEPEAARAFVVTMREETTALLLRWAAQRSVTRPDGSHLDQLAAEVTALAEEVESVDPRSQAGARQLCRRLCRIEVLAEGCQPVASPADAQPLYPAEQELRTGRPRGMTDYEVERFLSARTWGVLSTSGSDGPYGVPVSFGFDGAAAFIATRDGRKATHLRAAHAVCLSIVEVAAPDSWRSVVLRGPAVELSGMDRVRGMSTIVLQRGRTLGASPSDLLRAAGAAVYRIDPFELTGRTTG